MSDEKEQYSLIPRERLSDDIIEALVEEFVLREGTDYGHREVTLDGKKRSVMNQLDAGLIKIVFSHLTESATLVKADELGEQA